MHDLGSNFPNATGHVEGNDEYMPVEESGNMILMSYAYYKFSGDSSWLRDRYYRMTQWAQYLRQFSLIPGQQLSTDDFASQLANKTSLAIKGIVALSVMSATASALDNNADAQNYSSTASSYYDQWTDLTIDPSGTHTLLGYEWRSSWGLLYNIYPDRLLNLSLIPQSLYDMQCSYYPTVSQIFGVPLDNRHDYTKADWSLWVAATCSDPKDRATRRLFVDALAYLLNYTTTQYPFTDWYDTISTGGYPRSDTDSEVENMFIARPVVGGLFSLLALGKDRGTS